jgi:hypothetical protein
VKGPRTAWHGLEWLEQRTLLSADGLLPMATEASDDIPLAQAAVVENAAWFGAGHADAASAVLDGPGASDGDDLFGGAVPWMSDDAPAPGLTAQCNRPPLARLCGKPRVPGV